MNSRLETRFGGIWNMFPVWLQVILYVIILGSFTAFGIAWLANMASAFGWDLSSKRSSGKISAPMPNQYPEEVKCGKCGRYRSPEIPCVVCKKVIDYVEIPAGHVKCFGCGYTFQFLKSPDIAKGLSCWRCGDSKKIRLKPDHVDSPWPLFDDIYNPERLKRLS
jgi:hypothetical protein